jgi:AcrR family transcriptional regulator
MASIRLDSEERRKAIVVAALPLFARKGFSGTTTKEIAEAAGVSEALLFKHFPSKRHLYAEIPRLGCKGDPVLERLAQLEPSTATLVRMIHAMVHHFLRDGGEDHGELGTRLRLVLHSCLEDGEYARELFSRIFERVVPLYSASVRAAIAAGDLKPGPAPSENRFWFGQHIAAMIAFLNLPERSCAPYRGTTETLAAEASWFILRGIGLRDEAIAAALASLAREKN